MTVRWHLQLSLCSPFHQHHVYQIHQHHVYTMQGDADALLLLITDPAGMQILALSEVLRAQVGASGSGPHARTHWL